MVATAAHSPQPVSSEAKPAEQPSSANEQPRSGMPRWAKVGLVALAVIAAVGMAYYFYQTSVTEVFPHAYGLDPLRDVGVDPVTKRFVLDQTYLELMRKERRDCRPFSSVRPAPIECEQLRRSTLLETEHGKKANALVIDAVDKLCSEDACQRLADFPDKSIDQPDVLAYLANQAWLNAPYLQKPEGVKSLMEEHYVEAKTKDQPVVTPDPNFSKAESDLEACHQSKCPDRDSFCRKRECGSEDIAYLKAMYGYATHLTEKARAVISKVVQTLCPGTTCILSDQTIYDAIDKEMGHGNQ